MKKIYLILGLLALFVILPAKTMAANNTVMSGFSFKEASGDVDGFKTFKAGIGGTDVLVYLKLGQTKFVSFPVGMRAITDWQAGDLFNISGNLAGYNNGLLVIKANEIKFLTKDVSVVKQEVTVENLDKSDVNNFKLIVSSKENNNKYVLMTINRFGQDGGPIISNNTNIDFFVPGRTVTLSMLKRKINGNFAFKVFEVKKTDKPMSAAKRLIDIIKPGENQPYSLNPLLLEPVVTVRKNQIIIQNSGNGIIYLKNNAELKRLLNLPTNYNYFMLGANKIQIFNVKTNAPLDQQIALEFYTGTWVSGVLNSPIKLLEIAFKVSQ